MLVFWLYIISCFAEAPLLFNIFLTIRLQETTVETVLQNSNQVAAAVAITCDLAFSRTFILNVTDGVNLEVKLEESDEETLEFALTSSFTEELQLHLRKEIAFHKVVVSEVLEADTQIDSHIPSLSPSISLPSVMPSVCPSNNPTSAPVPTFEPTFAPTTANVLVFYIILSGTTLENIENYQFNVSDAVSLSSGLAVEDSTFLSAARTSNSITVSVQVNAKANTVQFFSLQNWRPTFERYLKRNAVFSDAIVESHSWTGGLVEMYVKNDDELKADPLGMALGGVLGIMFWFIILVIFTLYCKDDQVSSPPVKKAHKVSKSESYSTNVNLTSKFEEELRLNSSSVTKDPLCHEDDEYRRSTSSYRNRRAVYETTTDDDDHPGATLPKTTTEEEDSSCEFRDTTTADLRADTNEFLTPDFPRYPDYSDQVQSKKSESKQASEDFDTTPRDPPSATPTPKKKEAGEFLNPDFPRYPDYSDTKDGNAESELISEEFRPTPMPPQNRHTSTSQPSDNNNHIATKPTQPLQAHYVFKNTPSSPESSTFNNHIIHPLEPDSILHRHNRNKTYPAPGGEKIYTKKPAPKQGQTILTPYDPSHTYKKIPSISLIDKKNRDMKNSYHSRYASGEKNQITTKQKEKIEKSHSPLRVSQIPHVQIQPDYGSAPSYHPEPNSQAPPYHHMNYQSQMKSATTVSDNYSPPNRNVSDQTRTPITDFSIGGSHTSSPSVSKKGVTESGQSSTGFGPGRSSVDRSPSYPKFYLTSGAANTSTSKRTPEAFNNNSHGDPRMNAPNTSSKSNSGRNGGFRKKPVSGHEAHISSTHNAWAPTYTAPILERPRYDRNVEIQRQHQQQQYQQQHNRHKRPPPEAIYISTTLPYATTSLQAKPEGSRYQASRHRYHHSVPTQNHIAAQVVTAGGPLSAFTVSEQPIWHSQPSRYQHQAPISTTRTSRIRTGNGSRAEKVLVVEYGRDEIIS